MTLLRDKTKRNQARSELYASFGSEGLPVAKAVKGLRRVLALDQKAFAALCGISLSTLRKIEQERGNVTWATLAKVLAKFSLQLVVKSK